MAKYLEKKIDGQTVSFKFGVHCWRLFCQQFAEKGRMLPISKALQKVVVITDENPDGDIDLDAATQLIYFAAVSAAQSKKENPEAITEEMVEDWIEELGFMDFIAEAIEYAVERFTDQQKKPEDAVKGAPAKKKKLPSAK